MRRNRRGGGFHQDFGGSGEDSFVAVVVTKLTGALLFILLLTMVIMALIPKADQVAAEPAKDRPDSPRLVLEVPENLPEAVLGRRYEYAFSVRGDALGSLDWSIREELPQGLSFDPKNGRLIGSVNDAAVESVTLTVQVTDGRTVASAATNLPVWNPEKEIESAAILANGQGSSPELDAWLSQGFGLALIWFGHIAGMGVIGRMQRHEAVEPSKPARTGRFGIYRNAVRLMTIGLSAVLIYWMFVRP